MSSGEEQVTQDLVFDILSSARRRRVLYLLKTEGPMELTALAERVAARENDTTVEDLTRQQRKRVYVSLYQTHVPKLAEAGFVDHDQDSGVVSLRSEADVIDEYLGTEEESVPWKYVYGMLGALAVALGVLSAVGAPGFGQLSLVDVGIVVLVGFAVTAAGHGITWARSREESPWELRNQP